MDKIEELENKLNEIQKELEELKNPSKTNKRWVPKKDDDYYSVGSDSGIYHNSWDGDGVDTFRLNQYNIFKTEEEASHHLECLKIKAELRQLAEELNGNRVLDWEDRCQEKVFICYDHSSNQLDWATRHYIQYADIIYCLDGDFLTKAIERIGEQRLIDMIKEGV